MFMTCFEPDTLSIARPISTRSATSSKTCEFLFHLEDVDIKQTDVKQQ